MNGIGKVGGLLGCSNSVTLTDVSASGSVAGSHSDVGGTGGLVGVCWWTSILRGQASGASVTGGDRRGLVGQWLGFNGPTTSIERSRSAVGTVTGKRSVGGLVGIASGRTGTSSRLRAEERTDSRENLRLPLVASQQRSCRCPLETDCGHSTGRQAGGDGKDPVKQDEVFQLFTQLHARPMRGGWASDWHSSGNWCHCMQATCMLAATVSAGAVNQACVSRWRLRRRAT